MKSLFIVGPPGVGKTTLVRGLLKMSPEGELPIGSHLVPKPKWTVTPDAVAAGHYTGDTFDGADTVGYGDVNKTLDYWTKTLVPSPVPLTIFDGDRFSHASALEIVKEVSVVFCLHLSLGDDELERRRRERGSKQNEAWMKGRVTKARRFADDFDGEVKNINVAGLTPARLVAQAHVFVS